MKTLIKCDMIVQQIVEKIIMKNKKKLMLQLTIVNFALNIASILLLVLNQSHERAEKQSTKKLRLSLIKKTILMTNIL